MLYSSMLAALLALPTPDMDSKTPMDMGMDKDTLESLLLKKSTPSAGEHDWLIKHDTIQELVRLTNEERRRSGRAPVTLNTEMCLAAQQHAQWMAKTGWYQHSRLPYMEIIFRGPRSAKAAVNGWIYSPAHHGIMLSGSQVGFGYMKRNGATYWVGVFR